MKQLAEDLRAECRDLHQLVAGLRIEDWTRPTPFKGWSVNRVIRHLFEGDYLQQLTMKDAAAFLAFKKQRLADRETGIERPTSEYLGMAPLSDLALLEAWQSGFETMCDQFREKEPKDRVSWVGPDMSVRSAATARMMETWAHGQDIYDLLQTPRQHHDRLRNVAHLGVTTFGWTFQNRGLAIPGPLPYVRLLAPSGEIWEWGEFNDKERIIGRAVDFCRVVTQGRNVEDVALNVAGQIAENWMAIAQCFAGPPNNPPEPGARVWL